MLKIMFIFLTLALSSGFCIGTALGSAILEKSGRLEVDWTHLKLRYYGESVDQSGDFSGQEKKAWSEGLRAAQQDIERFFKEHYQPMGLSDALLTKGAQQAKRAILRKTYSVKSDFFPDGTVRVILEAPLASLLKRPGASFSPDRQLGTQKATFSGIVLRLDKFLEPKASFRIIDENGTLLYSEASVDETFYNKRLLGAWVKKSPSLQSARIVGKTPVSLSASVVDQKTIRVSSKAWREVTSTSLAIVRQARLLLVNP